MSLVTWELHLHKCNWFSKNHWYTIKRNMHQYKGCPRCCTSLMSAQHAWIPSSRMSLHPILQQDECQNFRKFISLKMSFIWIHFIKFGSSWPDDTFKKFNSRCEIPSYEVSFIWFVLILVFISSNCYHFIKEEVNSCYV
jgi:hypothetical protein